MDTGGAAQSLNCICNLLDDLLNRTAVLTALYALMKTLRVETRLLSMYLLRIFNLQSKCLGFFLDCQPISSTFTKSKLDSLILILILTGWRCSISCLIHVILWENIKRVLISEVLYNSLSACIWAHLFQLQWRTDFLKLVWIYSTHITSDNHWSKEWWTSVLHSILCVMSTAFITFIQWIHLESQVENSAVQNQ